MAMRSWSRKRSKSSATRSVNCSTSSTNFMGLALDVLGVLPLDQKRLVIADGIKVDGHLHSTHHGLAVVVVANGFAIVLRRSEAPPIYVAVAIGLVQAFGKQLGHIPIDDSRDGG